MKNRQTKSILTKKIEILYSNIKELEKNKRKKKSIYKKTNDLVYLYECDIISKELETLNHRMVKLTSAVVNLRKTA